MKLTREEKINKIYEVIADKTLSFGCRLLDPKGIFVEWKNNKKTAFTYFDPVGRSTRYNTAKIKYRRCEIYNHGKSIENKIKIIGHPVMIGDVLERMIYDQDLCSDRYDLIGRNNDDEPIRKKLKEPIENQTDACINFIYKLVKCYTT